MVDKPPTLTGERRISSINSILTKSLTLQRDNFGISDQNCQRLLKMATRGGIAGSWAIDSHENTLPWN